MGTKQKLNIIKEEELEVNTNASLLNWYLDIESIYTDLKSDGYKGNMQDCSNHLLYAMSEISAYNDNPTRLDGETLSEEEYFKLLVKKMNQAI